MYFAETDTHEYRFATEDARDGWVSCFPHSRKMIDPPADTSGFRPSGMTECRPKDPEPVSPPAGGWPNKIKQIREAAGNNAMTIELCGWLAEVCRGFMEAKEVTIPRLWEAMPRDVQKKISMHDLRRIVLNLNNLTEQDLAETKPEPV